MHIGRFDWSGQSTWLFNYILKGLIFTHVADFSETAENISFSIEGGADVPVLRARLQKLDGEYVDADVNLAERVSNDNGRLSFCKYNTWLVPLLSWCLQHVTYFLAYFFRAVTGELGAS